MTDRALRSIDTARSSLEPAPSARELLLCEARRAPESSVGIKVESRYVRDESRVRAAPVNHIEEPLPEIREIYDALVMGTRDYLRKNGFREAIVALSGGIDSSLVAAIAVDAVGARAVRGFAMPSRFSSDGSLADAEELSGRLDFELSTIPIEEAHLTFARSLTGVLGDEPQGLTDENLQSRIRGVLMMAISNASGAIVLTTGNKSEMAVGYSTLYGDTAGGFAVIKDVSKTLVYELCRYRNELARSDGDPEPIPDSVLEKPPSAELRVATSATISRSRPTRCSTRCSSSTSKTTQRPRRSSRSVTIAHS